MTYLNNDFEDLMKNRRSIREYDETLKISQEEMQAILTDAVTAPSSVNMQPWRFVVVESDAGKEKLKPLIRFNTLQNDTSSAMILIFGDLQNFENGEKIYGGAVERGLMPADIKEQQMAKLSQYFKTIPRSELERVVLIDGGIVAMQLMLVARAYGYDTNPIGGFERTEVAKAFGMNPERYEPVMIVSIGKAKTDGYDSYRLPIGDVTTFA
ncbi:nitroreductase family protein [Listeria ivanovii]|uniref:Nitroreductase family protein n=2 Tax=Listeria ivanovii TaxID=1638 RepID=A0ABS1G1Z0_LISIV|nr:nitroreductase family protein [Listeria ivanovii]EFR98467.1 putative NAD(P)H nitroreductase YdgI [Listeria ivanovii FSL F6-596]AIS58594.1 NAD(P)H nitroreductase [Listeria ivanovii subsp. londoniensis]AIS61391.1 NAD(P)H nitroreductase [Listeria ivanovii subsp. londoniensis]MBK1960883.1 nitroreductase family protein [Listeria ivanovii subsp. londoniensis]MBK1966128.1 nitroreductase family protein [Listeria ivanovii subsp. londoniensis]